MEFGRGNGFGFFNRRVDAAEAVTHEFNVIASTVDANNCRSVPQPLGSPRSEACRAESSGRHAKRDINMRGETVKSRNAVTRSMW